MGAVVRLRVRADRGPDPGGGRASGSTQQRLRPRLAVRARQPHGHHRSHRGLRPRRRPRLRRRPMADRRPSARLEHRARPHHRGHDERHRLLPGRPRLVPQDLHASARLRAQGGLAGVRRHLHGLGRVPQRQAGREPPLRLHRLRGRPGRRAHRRPHAERRRRPSPQQAPEQPLVLRQRDLPQRAPRRHRSGARRAPRDVRDHARRRAHRGERLRRRARAHGRRGRRARHERRDDRRRRPRPQRRALAPGDAGRRHRHVGPAPRAPAPVVDRRSLPVHAADRGPRRAPHRRPHHHALRRALVPRRPGPGVLARRAPDEDLRASICTTTRARSARRSTRTRSCAR